MSNDKREERKQVIEIAWISAAMWAGFIVIAIVR